MWGTCSRRRSGARSASCRPALLVQAVLNSQAELSSRGRRLHSRVHSRPGERAPSCPLQSHQKLVNDSPGGTPPRNRTAQVSAPLLDQDALGVKARWTTAWKSTFW